MRQACAGLRHAPPALGHLDTCQFETHLAADVPRVECAEHGVHQIAVPWAEPGSRFTMLMERVVIDWLKEASASAVSRRLRLSWAEVDGIMSRAVRRGLARREAVRPVRIGIDETSFQKRHEYVTVVTDLDRSRVLAVSDGRKEESLAPFFDGLGEERRAAVEVAAMDMWPAYMNAVARHLPNARIAFDKFHVAKHLGEAVDLVRRREHRELMGRGDDSLKRTKYLWLQKPGRMRDDRRAWLRSLVSGSLKTARAWAMKESAMRLWYYASRTWARRAWEAWLRWASRSRLEPMVRVGRTVRKHLEGILNAVVL